MKKRSEKPATSTQHPATKFSKIKSNKMKDFFQLTIMKKISLISLSLLFCHGLLAQEKGVGINTTTVASDAVLDINGAVGSANKGVLIPRMLTSERDAIGASSNGLLIYNTESDQFEYNSGGTWMPIGQWDRENNETLSFMDKVKVYSEGPATFADGGQINLLNDDNKKSIEIYAQDDGGQMEFRGGTGPNNGTLLELRSSETFGPSVCLFTNTSDALRINTDNNGNGLIAFTDTNPGSPNHALRLTADSGNGIIDLRNSSDISTIKLNNDSGGHGNLTLYDVNGAKKTFFGLSPFGGGIAEYYGGNLNLNVKIGNVTNSVADGFVGVYNHAGVERASIFVDMNDHGVIAANTKNFRMDHPHQPGKEIWYCSVEGPEAAAYDRGVGKLKNGEAFISFSDHYGIVANPETMTVVLTPHSADTYGLAVIEKRADGFLVKELKNGNGNFGFDWEVKCVRKGYEDYRVIRDARDSQPAPISSNNDENK